MSATVAAGIIGGLGALGATGLSVWNQRDLQKRDQQFQKFLMENSYQMQVQDMLKAGLNPNVAYSQMSSSTGHSSPISGDISASISQSLNNVFSRACESTALDTKHGYEMAKTKFIEECKSAYSSAAADYYKSKTVLNEYYKNKFDKEHQVEIEQEARNKIDPLRGFEEL